MAPSEERPLGVRFVHGEPGPLSVEDLAFIADEAARLRPGVWKLVTAHQGQRVSYMLTALLDEHRRLVAEVERLRPLAEIGEALEKAEPFVILRYEYDQIGMGPDSSRHVHIQSCDGLPMGKGATWREALDAAGLLPSETDVPQ